jgi:60 kDa SS-A/Ro ribonucleoprotein
MSYLKQYSIRRTPQSEPIPGADQVRNSAGGFAWAVDDWTRLRRFLILGSEGGSYYAGERELTRENADAVVRCSRGSSRASAAGAARCGARSGAGTQPRMSSSSPTRRSSTASATA